MSSFTGCSSNSTSEDSNTTVEDTNTTDSNTTIEDTNATNIFIINALENKDILSTASLLAQSEDTKVKISRDVESDMMNVSVLSGSVEVTELVAE